MMIDRLRALWWGRLPLTRAFWEYLIAYGTLANLITTIIASTVLASNGPAWLALLIHVCVIPYNIAAVVGVWRSADRYRGDPSWATLSRVAGIVWGLVATVA